MNEHENVKKIIDDRLGDYFKGKDSFQRILDYSISHGKRIRPTLLLACYSVFQETYDETVMEFALAIELIHNYSLIHDDLPAMDNDDYRRGNPTVHFKYGEDLAILAGDALLNHAFEILLDSIATEADEKKRLRKARAATVIAKNAGVNGMIGGQVLDIGNDFNSYAELLKMYDKKTCGLIKSATSAGAILGGAENRDVNDFEKYGYYLGLAYQIKDDLLDEKTDEESEKVTSLNFLTKEQAVEKVKLYSDLAIQAIERFDDSFLIGLAQKLIYREF